MFHVDETNRLLKWLETYGGTGNERWTPQGF